MNEEKLQKKDGKASGKSRKNKKYIKTILEELLLLDLPECKLREEIRKLGIVEAEISIQMAMCVMLVKQTLSGNLKAYQLLRDQIGENPKEDVVEPLPNIFFVNDISSKLKEKTEKVKEK